MPFKNNENKNRINLPVPLGAHQKVGIFFSKQQKTKELEQQNKKFSQRLQSILGLFHHQNEHLKQLKTKNSAIQNILSVIKVENQMMQNENQKIEQCLHQLDAEKQQLTQKQKILTGKMIQAQKELFDNTKKYQESASLLQRYQEELRSQKSLRYAADSIVNVVAKLQKDLQLIQRNVAIHKNKLEGKRKFRNLLQKKQQAQILQQEKANSKLIKSPRKNLNIYQRDDSSKAYSPRRKLQQVSVKQTSKNNRINIEAKKQNAKKFSQMTRKKNALMLQANSTKKI